jgi:SAM-dependent methyltransferase
MDVCWDRMAPAWDTHRDTVEAMKAGLTARLLDALEPLEGRRVLELGAGTGELAARLADAVGPTGSVLATDLSPGMVDLLEKRLAAVPNAEVATADAAALDLGEDAVDAVVFRMGLMMVHEPGRAVHGIRRVLRPGGTFATAVWATPAQNPWMTTVGMAMAMTGLVSGGPPVGPGGPFSLGEPADLERCVRDGGFDTVGVEQVDVTRLYRDAAELVGEVTSLSPALDQAWSAATPEQRAAVVEQVGALTSSYSSEAGVAVPATALLCTAR